MKLQKNMVVGFAIVISLIFTACGKGTEVVQKTAEFKYQGESMAPEVDVAGCDTFTQIVDRKLKDGQGYANETIGDTDAFLVCSSAFDFDGKMRAVDSTVLIYQDGVPVVIGSVSSGGSSYPLALKDKHIYTGSHHWVCKSTIEDGKLKILERAWVEYDSNGEETYYYEVGEKKTGIEQPDSTEYDRLWNEMLEADLIEYSVVQR